MDYGHVVVQCPVLSPQLLVKHGRAGVSTPSALLCAQVARGPPLCPRIVTRIRATRGLSPSVESPSGGASVAHFFYSPLLGYFENILVQPFGEGRDSLQRPCLGIFSNRLVLDQKHLS
jgi:hypothetical protein